MVGTEASLVAGALLGLSLAAPPGPVTALMAQAVARGGPRQGVAVGLGATTADACYLGLALAGAIAVLADRPLVLAAASLLGALLLAFFALCALRAARAARQGAREAGGEATFRAGFMAALTSPFNLAWWIGPGSVLIASAGLGLVAGLFVGIVAWVLLFTHALHALGRRIRRFHEGVAYASAAILALFAAWMVWRGAEVLGWIGA